MATYRKPLVDKDGNYIIPVVDSMDDYSTEEVDTQRKWIDGSTIYKKTINFGAFPNNTSKSVNHGITNLKSFVKIEGIMLNSTGQSCWALPYVGVQNLASSETAVIISSTMNLSTYNGYVTLYYTKTS